MILNTGNTSVLVLNRFQLMQLELTSVSALHSEYDFSSAHLHMHVFAGVIIRFISTLHKLLTVPGRVGRPRSGTGRASTGSTTERDTSDRFTSYSHQN